MLLWDNVPISSFEISLLPDTPTMYCCPDFRQLNKYNQVEMCIYHVSRGGEHGKERMPAIGGISYTTVPIRLQKRVVDVKITYRFCTWCKRWSGNEGYMAWDRHGHASSIDRSKAMCTGHTQIVNLLLL